MSDLFLFISVFLILPIIIIWFLIDNYIADWRKAKRLVGHYHGIPKSEIITYLDFHNLKYRPKNFVYCIINPKNSKKYIGLSNAGVSRFYSHLREYHVDYKKKLYRELKRDGLKLHDCIIVILYEGIDVDIVERKLIEKYDTLRNGYNAARGGELGGNKQRRRIYSPTPRTIEFPKRKTELEEIQDIREVRRKMEVCENPRTIKTFTTVNGVRMEVEIPIVWKEKYMNT